MHPDEVPTSVDLARHLIATQFPDWADLPMERVESGGTVNAIYRLGDQRSVRLPLQRSGALQLEKERDWLPRIGPQLPISAPIPIAHGDPTDQFPFNWAIYPWLPGAPIEPGALHGSSDRATDAARDLARFIRALQAIDPTGGPGPGPHNFGRGVPIAARDQETRAAIAASEGLADTAAVTTAWTEDSAAPTHRGSPVWVHGDLHLANLLAADGRLSAVIDWGGLGVGDPAVDLLPAWHLFSGESRDTFRTALAVDDATWTRGRAWALSVAIIALPYFIESNPTMVRFAHTMLDAVLADHAS